MSKAVDLSGGWDGIYNYPRTFPSAAFTATLVDSGGILTGETTELSGQRHDRGQTLHALIDGTRGGNAVQFVKTYDDIRRARSPIFYRGMVNGDKTEINGNWEIPGMWSGTFIMVRRIAIEVAVEREVAEPVS